MSPKPGGGPAALAMLCTQHQHPPHTHTHRRPFPEPMGTGTVDGEWNSVSACPPTSMAQPQSLISEQWGSGTAAVAFIHEYAASSREALLLYAGQWPRYNAPLL